MEILEIHPKLQEAILNADKKLSVELRVRPTCGATYRGIQHVQLA
jgi:hypothetical protein